MRIGGSLDYRGVEYFISLSEYKSKVVWHLISKVHKEDLAARITGKEAMHPELTIPMITSQTVPESYIIEAVSRTKVSGKAQVYGGKNVLQEVLDLIGMALSYNFSEQYVSIDQEFNHLGVKGRDFEANDGNLVFSYSRRNNYFTRLYIDYHGITLDISESVVIKVPQKLDFVEVKSKESGKMTINTIQSLDYKSLKELLGGLPWFEGEDGTFKKNYFPVTNIKDFEEKVIDSLMEEYQRCLETGEEFVIGLDTETSGLNLYNLSPENPDLDEIVCIPISWKDHESAVIFVAMEYFNNVPIDYVLSRLHPFVKWRDDGDPITVIPKRRVKASGGTLTPLHAFGSDIEAKDEVTYEWEDVGTYEIDRNKITLTGHNVMFDGRALYRHGLVSYWDDDTLQLAFNLNPKVIKGTNKLSTLIYRLFGYTVAELDDILGKGNEDKFRYISDVVVACLYAGSDTDYSRLVRRELIRLTNLMDPKLYKAYKEQDVPMLNLLYIPEYYGMNTEQNLFNEMAEVVEKDLEKLRSFLYSYVGTVVDFRNKRDVLAKKLEAGLIDREEFNEQVRKIKTEPNLYEFNLSGDQVREVLYGILGYPIKVRTSPTKKYPEGRPSVDKTALKRLMSYELDKPANTLKSDLISSDGKTVLLSSSKFNKLKYPVAYVLSKYAELNKEWTSYYQPMKEQNLEGKIFKSFSLTRIETRRIMNPGQTMKSELKGLIIPYDEDHYMCVFDQMQVEPRIMTSFSGSKEHIEKFKNPEKDYHTETAAEIIKIPPHKLSKVVRKRYKEVSLGIPYGLGDRKMCAKIYTEINEDTLFETRKDISLWKKTNSHIYETLQKFRERGLVPIDIPKEVKRFIAFKEEDVDIPYGMTKGMFPFYRLFSLDNLNNRTKASIQRMSGNFPIQETAAEIFRIILIRLANRCKKEGIFDKIRWHMLVHDELVFSVHKSVHPFFLYKILYESCTVTFKGHTTYFIGINIGNNWLDGKQDENEAPVLFVRRIIERWDKGEFRNDDYLNAEYTYVNAKGNTVTERGPKAYVTKHIHQYIKERIGEVVESIQKDVHDSPLNFSYIFDNFENYVVRSYVLMYYPLNFKPTNPKDEEEEYASRFESWVIDYFGEGKEVIGLDGVHKKIYRSDHEVIDLVFEEDSAEEEDTGYWTFDSEDLEESGTGLVFYEDEDLEEEELFLQQFDLENKEAKSISDLFVRTEPKYNYVRIINGQVLIKVARGRMVDKIKQFLLPKEDVSGYQVVFNTPLSPVRWVKVSKDLDLKELDDFVGGLHDGNTAKVTQ